MKAQDIANLIMIRDFTFRSIDNVLVQMSKEEVKALRAKLPMLDKKIIESVMNLDLSALEVPKKKKERDHDDENTK